MRGKLCVFTGILLGLGMGMGAQAHAQAVHDARAQDEHPDRVEVGGRVVGQQQAQWTLEFPGTPVGK